MSANSFARLENQTLIIGNAGIERRWRVGDDGLYSVSVLDRSSGHEWATGEAMLPSLVGAPPIGRPGPPTLHTSTVVLDTTGATALQADLQIGRLTQLHTYRFTVIDDFPAIGMQLISDSDQNYDPKDTSHDGSKAPNGLEAPAQDAPRFDATDVIDAVAIDPLHCWLVTTRFVDQTDHHHNLVFEDNWSLHPSEESIISAGNLWYLEHRPTASGLAILKIAPGPERRFPLSDNDFELSGNHLITRGHGGAAIGYRQWTVAYQGGRNDRIAAIQGLQLRLRAYQEERDGLLVSNTWGDRSRDARVTEPFILKEIAAAADLGVDVVQLDDGWQKGITANAQSAPQGGAWGTYWSIDPEFWSARPSGFPSGLGPIADACRNAGIGLGLWYSPDSSNEFDNWQRDVDQILKLVAEHGICQLKVDGIQLTSRRAEQRLHALIDDVLARTEGKLTFDADVTAQVRLGYWGEPHAGPVFVENRYTDWHNYWPHQTLRTIWRLSHHIHPMRLRMEFLNPFRNRVRYSGDPLAPANYTPAALFATVMMASPLAWFELSNTPAEFRHEIGSLVRIWKRHRARIFSGPILPIGSEPDGYTWSGFCTAGVSNEQYAVVYRPLDSDPSWSFEVARKTRSVEWLSGCGRASADGKRVTVTVDEPLGYGFLRIETDGVAGN